jgi:DNA-binding CsgD family transcriptional regulator
MKHAYDSVGCTCIGFSMGTSLLFDVLPLGVVIVRPNGQIVAANAIAADLLHKQTTLEIRNGILTSVSSAHQQVLSEGLQAIGAGLKRRVAFCIARSGLSPISIVCASQDSGKQIVVLISEPDRKVDPDVQLLADMFGFTRAEAVIAAQVIEGHDVTDIARTLQLSSHTVRNHLKSMFAKTNTNRFYELLHMLLRSPAGLNTRKFHQRFPVSIGKTAFPSRQNRDTGIARSTLK